MSKLSDKIIDIRFNFKLIHPFGNVRELKTKILMKL